ncbi:MAG: biopolymer transporter ExbD [Candidatus Adiutrix sp.]|jgi:biopolymer transport protein ExbD|nr:biopolymer transporter ExbD [Candidatus Adiutrix sp.]
MNFRPVNLKESAGIYLNMTPLVDVVLLLLLFFMVTAQFGRLPGLKMLLPPVDAATAARVGASERLELSITAEGDIVFENQPATLSSLSGLLNRAGAAGDEVVVVVSADQGVLYGRMVRVMDILRQAGFNRVVLSGRVVRAGEEPGD